MKSKDFESIAGERRMDTVVELFTGFLDSGKTTLIKAALNSPDFLDYETTLLLVCEEGEEEYDEDYLSDNHIIKMVIDEEEKLNPFFWKAWS